MKNFTQFAGVFIFLVIGIYVIYGYLQPGEIKAINKDILTVVNQTKAKIPVLGLSVLKNTKVADILADVKAPMKKLMVQQQESLAQFEVIYRSLYQQTVAELDDLKLNHAYLNRKLNDIRLYNAQFLQTTLGSSEAVYEHNFEKYRLQTVTTLDEVVKDFPMVKDVIDNLVAQTHACGSDVTCLKERVVSFDMDFTEKFLSKIKRVELILSLWVQAQDILLREVGLLRQNTLATSDAMLALSEQMVRDIQIVQKNPKTLKVFTMRMKGWIAQQEAYWLNITLNQQRFIAHNYVWLKNVEDLSVKIDDRLFVPVAENLKAQMQKAVDVKEQVRQMAERNEKGNEAFNELMAEMWKIYFYGHSVVGDGQEIAANWMERKAVLQAQVKVPVSDTSELNNRLVQMYNELIDLGKN